MELLGTCASCSIEKKRSCMLLCPKCKFVTYCNADCCAKDEERHVRKCMFATITDRLGSEIFTDDQQRQRTANTLASDAFTEASRKLRPKECVMMGLMCKAKAPSSILGFTFKGTLADAKSMATDFGKLATLMGAFIISNASMIFPDAIATQAERTMISEEMRIMITGMKYMEMGFLTDTEVNALMARANLTSSPNNTRWASQQTRIILICKAENNETCMTLRRLAFA